MKTQSDLYAEMQVFGLITKPPNIDGLIHRCGTTDKPRSENGWYVAKDFGSFLTCQFGNWRTQETVKWASKDQLNHIERAALKTYTDESEKSRQEEADQAAIKAAKQYSASIPADPNHGYLQAKAIKPHAAMQIGNLLLIPAINEHNEIRTYQTIAPDGTKDFLWRGGKKGTFHLIGNDEPELICEGFATGASLHEATGKTVAVAFDAGNIPNISQFFKNAVVAADNDLSGTGERYAKKSGLKYVVPPETGVDWNDMAKRGDNIRSYFVMEAKPGALPFDMVGDIKSNLNATDFVQGIFAESQLSVIYGPSNCGKTFFATDLAFHVAMGLRWRDKRVNQGSVVYVGLEGMHGLNNRIAAYKQENPQAGNMPMAIVTTRINFMDPAETSTIPAFIATIQQVAEQCGQVKLVIVDTLARAMAGGDENSGQDMGLLVDRAEDIKKVTGAHVCFIHHSGKDQAKGARGHSSLQAAIDTEIEIKRSEDKTYSNVSISKQRDLEILDDMQFKLDRVLLGQNQYGEDVTSCVVVPYKAPDEKERSPIRPKNYENLVLEAIQNGLAKVGVYKTINDNRVLCITYSELAAELTLLGDKEMDADQAKNSTTRIRAALRDKGLIGSSERNIWAI